MRAGRRLLPRGTIGRVAYDVSLCRLHDLIGALAEVVQLGHRVVLHDYGATAPFETAIGRRRRRG